MRTLHFEPGTRRYELAHQALLFSPLPVHPNERKAHGELLDKLEAIGELKLMLDGAGQVRAYTPDEVRLYVSPAGGDVTLSEGEFDLLCRHVEAVVAGPMFAKALLREADAFIDALKGTLVHPPVSASA